MYEFLLVFGVVLWLAVGAFYVRKPVASMYHPLTYYMLVHGLVFVIRPILAFYYNYDGIYIFYEFIPTIEEKCMVLFGSDLGFIAFALASLKLGSDPINPKYSSYNVLIGLKEKRTFLIVSAICLPIGVYSLAATLRGTANVMEMDAATGIVYNISGNGYFYDSQLMVGPICVVLAWIFRFKLISILPFICYLAAKASTGGRGPFIQAFIAFWVLYFYSKKKKWPNLKLVAPVIGIIALFTAVGSNREVIHDAFTGQEVASKSSNSTQRPLEGMDYGNMEYFEYLMHAIPNKTGTYGYFLDNLQILTEPIPRVFWHGKPLGAPVQMYDLMAYGHPIGMTSSIPGEGWAQAGWFGIVFWCGLFGAFYGWLYKKFVNSQRSVVQVSLYIIFLSASFVTFRDGVLLTIVKSSLFTLLPLLLWGSILRFYRVGRHQ